MACTLYHHPLSSFCQKVLTALYENDTPFTPRIVDLFDEADAAELGRIWPIGQFPVLRDEDRNLTIPESSIIIEYIDHHFPGATRLIPADPDRALQTRQRDRFFDLYVNVPMQRIVGERLRPEGAKDPHGAAKARAQLHTACGMIDADMASMTWATGEEFGMADCAAAPALYYANLVAPLGEAYPNAAAYLDRLMQRASFARVVDEAAPYRNLFPH